MFIGHFGVAMAAKRVAPRTSLGVLIFAAQFLDLLWPILLLAGLEHVRIAPGIMKAQSLDFYDYPFSHSLTFALRWSALIGLLYFLWRRQGRSAWVVGALVLSHWVLDLVVHRSDLPLWPGGPKYGLGLWNSWAATLTSEVLLLGIGMWLYLGITRSRDGVGVWGFWGLIVLIFLGWIAALFGPPPPNPHQLAISAVVMWLLVPWAWWADAHREIAPS